MEDLVVKSPAQELDVFRLGDVMAKSGFFSDSAEAAQAVVKILVGRELGIGPAASMMGVHIIKTPQRTSVQLSANLLASLVEQSPVYTYQVKELTDEVCMLHFYRGSVYAGESRFTLADAKRAGTKNLDKYPRNMLFARAMSNGVKWFAPGITSGNPVYTPGELEEIDTEAPPKDKPEPFPPDAIAEPAKELRMYPQPPTYTYAAVQHPAQEGFPPASEKQIELIRMLLKSHLFTEKERAGIENRINDGRLDGHTCIAWLKEQASARKQAEVGPPAAEEGAGSLPFDDKGKPDDEPVTSFTLAELQDAATRANITPEQVAAYAKEHYQRDKIEDLSETQALEMFAEFTK